jgi:hypothetical protein
MRYAFFAFIFLAFSVAVLAQDRGETTTVQPSNRTALLKEMVARDRGEITALEPSSKEGGGVIIGYSSGAILNCYGGQSCREFHGTPGAGVEHLVVSKRGASEIIWVTYLHGALYQCVNSYCNKFNWDGAQQK